MWTVLEYFDPKTKGVGCWGVPASWVDEQEMIKYYPSNWVIQRKTLCDPEPSWKSLPIKRILFAKIGK